VSSGHAKQEEDGELWAFLKFQKSLLTVSLLFLNTSFNHLGKVWSVL